MINFEGVINPLSFGYISYGIAKEFIKRKIDFNFFPISGNVDWGTFDTAPEDIKNYINNSANNSLKQFNINNHSFKIWHINPQSIPKMSKKFNSILTFHELDTLTDEEVCILNSFDKVFVTSTFSKNVFEDFGVKSKVVYAPMGIDTDVFFDLKKPRIYNNIIVFSIFGKFEKRKRQLETIQAWITKYGGNPAYKLHCYVSNPFYKPEQMNQVFAQIFQNKPKPFNVDLFPYLPNNSTLNDAYNSTDIVLDMSGGESISLPSLNCVAIGKHAVVNYNTGIKDWANDENCVLIKPNGKEPVYDGVFFQQGSKFNQGNIYTFDVNDLYNGIEAAITRFNASNVNEAGKKLQNLYSFKVGVDIIEKELGG